MTPVRRLYFIIEPEARSNRLEIMGRRIESRLNSMRGFRQPLSLVDDSSQADFAQPHFLGLNCKVIGHTLAATEEWVPA